MLGRLNAAVLLASASLIVPVPLAMSYGNDGVKHSVAVSITVDPKLPADLKPFPTGTVTLTLRISAHSKTADFAGDISEMFENIELNKGAPFRTIWNQDQCHERRGLPRIWVQNLSGSIIEGKNVIPISAIPRHIGVPLPEDELKTEQQVETFYEAGQSERILRARTSASHFLIEVKLTSTPCFF